MANPPKLKRLRPEDFDFEAEASEWGPKLLEVLTQFCGDVTSALTGQLTRPQNVKGASWEVTFTTGGSIAIDAAPFPLYVTPSFSVDPKNFHLWITGAEDITDATATAFASGVFPHYRLTSDGRVCFRHFTGLNTSRRYRIRGLME